MRTLNLTFNASGAVQGAQRGDLVVVVDVIDMSTSAEVALEKGAVAVLGAAPSNCRLSLKIDPQKIGLAAGKIAAKHQTEVVIIAEPRYGTEEERSHRAQGVISGVRATSAPISRQILPNIGTELGSLADFTNKVVLIVSDTGGVAFDVAYNNGAAAVLTATITRTSTQKGLRSAQVGVQRIIETAEKLGVEGITIVAASANSYEDVLAAQKLTELMIEKGFLS